MPARFRHQKLAIRQASQQLLAEEHELCRLQAGVGQLLEKLEAKPAAAENARMLRQGSFAASFGLLQHSHEGGLYLSLSPSLAGIGDGQVS